VTGDRHLWVDASAGVAGDMLLGALLDAGADGTAVQRAVDAVLDGAAQVRTRPVTRAGLRALKADVHAAPADPPHRTWRDIRDLLDRADLPVRVRERARQVFAGLADAEAQVHGITADEVHFHEVGALDAIADVVGTCAALEDLGVATMSASGVAVGSGEVRSTHGTLPVPAPAVLQLARGWRVYAGGPGELATPTGMALLRALCTVCEDLPSMRVETVGVGAGGRDLPDRANVVRVVAGPRTPGAAAHREEPLHLLEANVDDLDPRLWPGILTGLLRAGAADAWLVPIVMKKGRPAHTLTVLCAPGHTDRLRAQIFRDTSTLGVRQSRRGRVALARAFLDVAVAQDTVAVKVAHRDGVIVQAAPEFDDVAAAAHRQGRPERLILQEAAVAAAAAGLTVGAALPPGARPG
jgi:pyridinium-3,5-bisthiocarboxylic acid mononucleotide nickel chelatase